MKLSKIIRKYILKSGNSILPNVHISKDANNPRLRKVHGGGEKFPRTTL